ncbi:hypothetical protein TNCV_2076811 [Trichonephila clavipes]|nr:hypothetical protein TNCV_2076811 [Trichonephila clavipes]
MAQSRWLKDQCMWPLHVFFDQCMCFLFELGVASTFGLKVIMDNRNAHRATIGEACLTKNTVTWTDGERMDLRKKGGVMEKRTDFGRAVWRD